MHTRQILDYGGVVSVMPKFALFLMVFTLANIGLPGTSGFVGEFLTIMAIFSFNKIFAFFAASGVILSAVYGSVVLYWLGDESENSKSTWEFLERRIQNVMLFESFKAKLKSDPFISKKLTIPKKILEKINKPSDIRELKVPDTIDDK